MPRVLLVDDDIAEISAVKRVLARAGHQAVLATNASDALAAVTQASPAVLVVASSCEAGEALRRLAADGAAGGIPIVVLGESASAPAGAVQLARPVDLAQLADRLAAALGAPPPAAAGRRAVRGAPATLGRIPVDRRAAADALRARAEELRRGAVTGVFAAAVPTAAADADERETPVSLADDPGSDAVAPQLPALEAFEAAPAPDAATAVADAVAAADAALAELEAPAPAPPPLDLEHDPGLEAILRRAEEAEVRARRDASRRAADQQAVRAAEDQARRASETDDDDRARAERGAREHADRQLERLRREIDDERRAAGARARLVPVPPPRAAPARLTVAAPRPVAAPKPVAGPAPAIPAPTARASAPAAQAARVSAPAVPAPRPPPAAAAREHPERESEEAQLRAAIQSARDEMEALRRKSGAEEEQLRAAIQSARDEMEALRKRSEEEGRRRAEAEAEVARLAREAERSAADAAARPPPLEVPVYRPPAADPEPDPAQASVRRRVAAMREPPPAPPGATAAPPAPAAAPEPVRVPIRPPPAELRSGTLTDLPAPRLLALAARTELCGRIDVEGEASRSLFFDAGRVVGATSSAPGERVEEVALRLGLVTRDQHRLVAASAAPLSTRRAAVMLLERGFLKPAELGPLVRRRTEEVVFGVFGDPGARFRWSAAEVPADESTALERTSLQLAVEGVRRRWLAPELDAVLGGDATLLVPVAGGSSAAELGLSPDERRVLALADGLRTVDEVLATSPLDVLTTRQVLAAVVLAGSLAVRTFQGGRPAAAASAAIDLARVRDKLEQARRADYFTILGVGRLCTPHEVREAFERLRAEFDPRRYQGLREEGLDARLDEIQRVVADARDVLADERLRAEYLRGLGD